MSVSSGDESHYCAWPDAPKIGAVGEENIMTSTVALPETTTPSKPTSDWRPHAMTGMAYGAFIMGFFGCMWLVWGAAALTDHVSVLIGAALVFAASLWIPAAALLRRGSRAVRSAGPLGPEARRQQARMGKMFGFIFGGEGLLIFLVVNGLNNIGLRDYGISAIAAIVGLHFLPLARLYRLPMYNVVGIIMTAAALASVALPASIRISVLASTMSVIVWVTCLLVVRKGFALGRDVQTAT
jgi:hypothetical protein